MMPENKASYDIQKEIQKGRALYQQLWLDSQDKGFPYPTKTPAIETPWIRFGWLVNALDKRTESISQYAINSIKDSPWLAKLIDDPQHGGIAREFLNSKSRRSSLIELSINQGWLDGMLANRLDAYHWAPEACELWTNDTLKSLDNITSLQREQLNDLAKINGLEVPIDMEQEDEMYKQFQKYPELTLQWLSLDIPPRVALLAAGWNTTKTYQAHADRPDRSGDPYAPPGNEISIYKTWAVDRTLTNITVLLEQGFTPEEIFGSFDINTQERLKQLATMNLKSWPEGETTLRLLLLTNLKKEISVGQDTPNQRKLPKL